MNILIRHLLETKQAKLDFFQNLILVAIADGYVDDSESDFLLSIGRQLGLTKDDTAHIADNLSSLSFKIPQSDLQKELELQTLVMMVWQDGILEDKEYALCLEYATAIGYAKPGLDTLINKMK